MPIWKQNRKAKVLLNHFANSSGFTMIELIVVLGIMAVLFGFLVLNIAGTRSARNLRLAQNRLVTDLRKIQSNALYSRDVSPGQPAEFHIIKFDLTKPDQYQIQAIYNYSSPPAQMQTLETIKLPQEVRLAAVTSSCSTSGVCITRPSPLSAQVPTSCALVAFKVPFGKVIANENCIFNNFSGSTDDYRQIAAFVGNGGASDDASSDSIITIRLQSTRSSLSNSVTINGISGGISFQ